MSLKTLYHVWIEGDGSFGDCEGQPYHQIESMSAPEYAAERWVEERYDPHHGYPSVDGDGLLVVVRDPSGKETTVRVYGARAILYSAFVEDSTNEGGAP